MKLHKFLKNIKHKKDFLYFLSLLTLIIILKLPTMNLDYHWDETVFAVQAKYHSIFGFFKIPPGRIVHVPFFIYFVALNYKLFGESSFISHFIVAIFSFIGAYFTYLLGKFLFNNKIGIIASLFLFFSPMYFALSGQLLYEIPLAAMTVVTLYFGLKREIIPYIISASILVLTKEPGVLVIIALLIYFLIEKIKIKKLLIYSLPIFFLFLWFIWFKSQVGHFVSSDFFAPTNIVMIIKRFAAITYQVFLWNYNWLLTIPVALMLFREKIKIVQLPLILIIIFYIILFSVAPIYLLPRYLLPISPLFFILSSAAIYKFFRGRLNVVVLLVILLFITCYRYNWGIKGFIQDPIFHSTIFYPKNLTSVVNGELNLDYIDIVKTEDQTLDFIFNKYSNSVVAPFPLFEDAGLEINVGNRQWSKYNIKISFPSNESIKNADLIIYEQYSWPENVIVNFSKLELIKKFEQNEKYTIIYVNKDKIR
jgi:hypothetical protein